jgi:hypothetical protein
MMVTAVLKRRDIEVILTNWLKDRMGLPEATLDEFEWDLHAETGHVEADLTIITQVIDDAT